MASKLVPHLFTLMKLPNKHSTFFVHQLKSRALRVMMHMLEQGECAIHFIGKENMTFLMDQALQQLSRTEIANIQKLERTSVRLRQHLFEHVLPSFLRRFNIYIDSEDEIGTLYSVFFIVTYTLIIRRHVNENIT
jgi:hypothetical protein